MNCIPVLAGDYSSDEETSRTTFYLSISSVDELSESIGICDASEQNQLTRGRSLCGIHSKLSCHECMIILYTKETQLCRSFFSTNTEICTIVCWCNFSYRNKSVSAGSPHYVQILKPLGI